MQRILVHVSTIRQVHQTLLPYGLASSDARVEVCRFATSAVVPELISVQIFPSSGGYTPLVPKPTTEAVLRRCP